MKITEIVTVHEFYNSLNFILKVSAIVTIDLKKKKSEKKKQLKEPHIVSVYIFQPQI